MSNAPYMRVLRFVLPTLALFACTKSQQIERYPIAPFHLEFADTLQAGSSAETLVIDAIVGYEGCMPENVTVLRSGDSLFVSGWARCVVRENVNATTPARVQTPPAVPNALTLTTVFPALEPGAYRLFAGALSDTLYVSTPPPRTPVRRIASRGLLAWSQPDSCPSFYGGIGRTYALVNPPEALHPHWPVFAYGKLDGVSQCASSGVALRLRRYYFDVPEDWPKPSRLQP